MFSEETWRTFGKDDICHVESHGWRMFEYQGLLERGKTARKTVKRVACAQGPAAARVQRRMLLICCVIRQIGCHMPGHFFAWHSGFDRRGFRSFCGLMLHWCTSDSNQSQRDKKRGCDLADMSCVSAHRRGYNRVPRKNKRGKAHRFTFHAVVYCSDMNKRITHRHIHAEGTLFGLPPSPKQTK